MKRMMLLLLAASLSLPAGEYVVVAGAVDADPPVESRALAALFLKKRGFLGESAVVPVNLSPSDPIRIAFEEKVLGMERDDLNDYWIEKHYRGVSPPVVQRSQNGVKAFLKNVAGAVGYIEKKNLEPGLKVLHEF